ncbi:MAG: hypothetical protein ACR2OZ_00090 [Verrucomicrobiales bacterium]
MIFALRGSLSGFAHGMNSNAGKPTGLDPLRHVGDAGAHRGLVFKDLVLPLVETTEDHDGTLVIARFNDPGRPSALAPA